VQKNANLEAQRTPTTFRSIATAIAAASVIWTPAAGRRFRLMGGIISFAGPIYAAAAINQISFQDEATDMQFHFNFWVPTVAEPIPHIAFDLKPNGYLSLVADNRLRVLNSGGNFTAGNIRITVWGTEEV